MVLKVELIWRHIFCLLLAINYYGTLAGVISDKVRIPECDGENAEHLIKIRAMMKDPVYVSGTGTISAYMIPNTDAHNTEYVGEHDKRLQFVTNFTGSMGTAIITEKKAMLWVDSRYHLQAEQQVDRNCWIVMKIGKKGIPTMTEWLNQNLIKEKIGVDPFVITSVMFRKLNSDLKKNGNSLVSVKRNLVDEIWTERPATPQGIIYPLDLPYTGQTVQEKIEDVRKEIKRYNASSLVVSALDDVAWLLNLRGSDIQYTPVFYSYVIVTLDEFTIFVNKRKMFDKVRDHLLKSGLKFEMRSYEEILRGVNALEFTSAGKIIVSKDVSEAIYEMIPTNRLHQSASIVGRLKTIKNDIEAKNMIYAHIRDGIALVRFFHWMEITIDSEEVTELSAASKVNEFRSQQRNFKGLSFETISAFGSNAAMAHYNPSPETNRVITRNEIYLIDSGGQYLDGTTDVTRTVHFGEPQAHEKECFTRVLKGFIALATSVFPVNTSLKYFDQAARRYLKEVGLNYGHGTGHGVGAFLGVHEYPPLINSAGGNDPGALENMFTSNEPGYYEDGKFGIRIEDVVQIVKADLPDAFNHNETLSFRSITLAPIQRKMIDTSLLTKDEQKYINDYHKRVFNILGPILLQQGFSETYKWLLAETKPISICKDE